MLSRLISLLRRIPAVNWAFTRLRPLPHDGSIDVVPIAASEPPAADIAEAAPSLDAGLSIAPRCSEAEIVVATPVAETDTVIAESPSAAPTDINVCDRPTPETSADVEPVVVEEVAVSSAESEPVEAPAVSSNDAPAEFPANVEPVVAEATVVAPADVAIASADAPILIGNDDTCSGLPADVELAIVDDSCVALADREVSAEHVAESSIDSARSPSVAQIEPVLADDSAPDATIDAADSSTDAPGIVTEAALEQVPASSAPEIRIARKPGSKVAEPADRAALIRQRWTETGIRMWNPRLHGTGEATLNIQGSVGLLPPAPGETMPRYDKLEFKMLGGQIVCEGVIVEAPAQASHRSFTRLAEPGKLERVREPARERQAVLA